MSGIWTADENVLVDRLGVEKDPSKGPAEGKPLRSQPMCAAPLPGSLERARRHVGPGVEQGADGTGSGAVHCHRIGSIQIFIPRQTTRPSPFLQHGRKNICSSDKRTQRGTWVMNCQLERPGRNQERGRSRYREKFNQEHIVSSREGKKGLSGGETKGS